MSGQNAELYRLEAEISKWAEAKRMLGNYGVVPDFDLAVVGSAFRAVGLQSATSILQDRQISYIGVNEPENAIIIYTSKPLRQKDRSILEKAGTGSISVIFRHAYQLSSGDGVPPQSVAPPFELTAAGVYTCGSSISIANEPTAGTIGCLLADQAGNLYALSNNHVFAGNNYAEIGIPIIIPGQADIAANSRDPVTLGHLHTALPLIDGNPAIVAAYANVDAAIIRIRDASLISSSQRNYYDTPDVVTPILPGMRVEKVGRTTGRTFGTVASHHTTPQNIKAMIHRIGSFKILFFMDIFGIVGDGSPFSKPGDSGSIITNIGDDGIRRAVGLVFAGNDDLSFAVSIDKVLPRFGLTVVSGHNI